MSLLIKGMEMPNKKNGAVLIIYPDGRCAFEDGSEYAAVPVPPHGRLIDADAEETVVHCNNEENARIIATLLDMDADGHYLTYSSIFGEEEEPAQPKEEKIS